MYIKSSSAGGVTLFFGTTLFTNIAETTHTDRGVASISTSCRPPADFRLHIC